MEISCKDLSYHRIHQRIVFFFIFFYNVLKFRFYPFEADTSFRGTVSPAQRPLNDEVAFYLYRDPFPSVGDIQEIVQILSEMFAEESRHALYHVVAVGQYISPQIFKEHVVAEFFVCFLGKAPHKAGERLCFLDRQQLRHHQNIFGRYFLRQHFEIPFHFRLCHFTYTSEIFYLPFSGCGEKEHRDGRGKVKCNAGSASQRNRRKCCVQNKILKSKKEPSKERPCSALIVYRSIRFKQDFLTVDLGEELCYHSHNGNGKIRRSPCQRFDRGGVGV